MNITQSIVTKINLARWFSWKQKTNKRIMGSFFQQLIKAFVNLELCFFFKFCYSAVGLVLFLVFCYGNSGVCFVEPVAGIAIPLGESSHYDGDGRSLDPCRWPF